MHEPLRVFVTSNIGLLPVAVDVCFTHGDRLCVERAPKDTMGRSATSVSEYKSSCNRIERHIGRKIPH